MIYTIGVRENYRRYRQMAKDQGEPFEKSKGGCAFKTADAARQCIDVGTGRLPVGVVTALVGGPAFLWILRRRPWSQ